MPPRIFMDLLSLSISRMASKGQHGLRLGDGQVDGLFNGTHFNTHFVELAKFEEGVGQVSADGPKR